MIWTLPALYDDSYVQRSGEDFAFTTITANATQHVKGAWTEMVAADAYDFDVAMCVVRIKDVVVSAANTAMLIDIGIGGSGSEQVWIPDLLAGGDGSTPYWIPLYLPAGTRIAARCQALIGGDTAAVNVDLYGCKDAASHPLVYHAIENCGADSADSDGQGISVGSWTTLDASTTYPATAIVPMFSIGGNLGGDTNTVDVGIGGAGSEVIIMKKIKVSTGASENISDADPTAFLPMSTRIPAGTRIAMTRAGGRDLAGAVLLLR